MIYIAHRGLFFGPDPTKENHPDQINLAIDNGFQCEIDVWFVDGQLYLGHDKPDYKTDINFIDNHLFWVHAKNVEALSLLNGATTECNYFWHQNDKYTLTSKQYMWVNPGEILTKGSVMVMPEAVDVTLSNTQKSDVSNCYAICSDYVQRIKEMRCD